MKTTTTVVIQSVADPVTKLVYEASYIEVTEKRFLGILVGRHTFDRVRTMSHQSQSKKEKDAPGFKYSNEETKQQKQDKTH